MKKTPLQLQLADLIKHLPVRAKDAHKGNFGHVLVIGGDFGYAGAPILAALGALRVGSGLVTVATHRYHLVGLNAVHPELMTAVIDDPEDLTTELSKATVLVLGPGLGRSKWSEEVFNIAISAKVPMVVDADGLFFLKDYMTTPDMVITPHPGEAAHLLQEEITSTKSERLAVEQRLITTFNCTAVLKGAGSLVGSPDSKIHICKAGNAGMASGGMGDLLSGVIAGLMAQGMSGINAAQLGVCVHALAGDTAAMQEGTHGLIATDLLSSIRSLLG